MSPIASATIVHDVLEVIHDYLTLNLTDPKSAQRAATNTSFVMTTWPEKRQLYPHVLIAQIGGGGRRRAGNTQNFRIPLVIAIEIQSLSTEQCDSIVDNVLDKMWSGNASTFEPAGLHFMSWDGPRPIEDLAPTGVHRKLLEYSFMVFRK